MWCFASLFPGLLAIGLTHHQASAWPWMAESGSMSSPPPSHQPALPRGLKAASDKKGVFYMNRIAPSAQHLYVAPVNGIGAPQLLLGANASYDYHPSFSPDGEWIVFTSERAGDGQADLYRVRTDGTGLELLVGTPAIEDAGVLSPDGTQLAYVSSANGYKANIWVLDIATGETRNLTNTAATLGDPDSPEGHFMPAWSPDGEWIMFTSDRNTDWELGTATGWEHIQELAIYAIRPDGTDMRKVIGEKRAALGSPKFSADGQRIVYYQMTRQQTWDVHQPTIAGTNQIMSTDFATGTDTRVEAVVSGFGLNPSYIGPNSSNIGYLVKAGDWAGVNYTSLDNDAQWIKGTMRAPAWSPDGTRVAYEVPDWTLRADEAPLYSFDSEWEYRHIDIMPLFNNATGKMVYSQKQRGNTEIVTAKPDGSEYTVVFSPFSTGWLNSFNTITGNAGAYQPSFSGDGDWITFGLGWWFQNRTSETAYIYRVRANGSDAEQLTPEGINAGFPSYSPDGRYIVYRLMSDTVKGLRVIDLQTGSTTNLTYGWDNMPGWSPDGERIVFTRRNGWDWATNQTTLTNMDRYDVWTIRPDGTDAFQVTTALANDGHAVWANDGRILYSTGEFGFRNEAANYDNTFQPYGVNMVINADGTGKQVLTESLWEDSMPMFVWNEFLS